jgi:hypothetical protein
MPDENWFFNKNEYKVLKKDHLKRKFKEPKGFIAIKYLLPFELPLENHTRTLFHYKNRDLAMITKNHEYEKNVHKGITLPNLETEVEIVLFSYEYLTVEIKEERTHKAIDFTLEFLQRFLEMVMVKHETQGVYRIARQDLPYVIPVLLIRSPNFKESAMEVNGILNMHFNKTPKHPKKLNSKQINTLIELVNDSDNSPFIDSVVYIRESKIFLETGNYKESVIHLQTSIETFMYTFYRLVLVNRDKLTKDKVKNKLGAGYKNILNDHLSKIFSEVGYIFKFEDKDDSSNLLNEYMTKVYSLRNKVVHEGYRCSENEANEAFYIGKNMLIDILEVINNTPLKDHAFLGVELISGRVYE